MKNNIGNLNAIFMQNISNLFAKKNGAMLIKEYISLIKDNKPLLKEYLVYENILNQKNCNNVEDCITENINYLDSLDKKELTSLNEKLTNFMVKNKIKQVSEIKDQKLFEDIHKLIFTKKTIKNINERVETLNNITNYIIENNIKTDENEKVEINENSDAFYKYTINKFNTKYEDVLNEEEKKVFKSIVSAKNLSEKNEMFEDHRKECLNLTNSFLKESIDLSTREKLLNVKEKLLEQKYTDDSFITDILSFFELKQTLTV